MKLIIVGLVALMVGAGVARAESEESAAARFQQGVELYREGSFEGALAEFRRAYQLNPSYRVLYNIAQAQHALRDFVAAHKSLMQYLADGGADVTGERRTQVEEMAAKLADRIAFVHISVNCVGADVRIDDVSVGASPLSGPIAVNLGTRKVTATKPGAPAAVRVLTLAGREHAKIDLAIDEVAPRATAPLTAAAAAAAPSLATTAPKPQPAAASGHAALVTTLSMTAALAVGTGVCGYLALGAQRDLKDQVATFPNTRDTIEEARSRSRTYGTITDALAAATILSGGAALYLALTSDWHKPTKSHASILPTLGGVVVQGGF